MATPRGAGSAPRAPFRIPKPLQSRKARWVLFAILAFLLILLFSLRGIAGFYTDFLWFDALGQSSVWRRVLVSQIVLALIFIGFLGALLYGNLALADRIAPSLARLARKRKRCVVTTPPLGAARCWFGCS